MNIREMLDLMNIEKRRRERARATQNLAIGVFSAAVAGVAVGILLAPKSGKETRDEMKNKCSRRGVAIKETIHEKAEMLKEFAADAEQAATDVIKDVTEKADDVRKDIKEGSHDIKDNVRKTAANVSNDIHKSVK